MNTDIATAVTDHATDTLFVLFNTEEGRRYLVERRGIDRAVVEGLVHLGLSGICNMLAAIKMARYFDFSRDDVIMTIFTDSAEMYGSRLSELTAEHGAYDETRAGRDLDAITVAWVGGGNNVLHSWLEASMMFGFQLRVAVPDGFEPDAGLYLAAIIRLAMPTQRGLWIYRTRRSAARFVLASTAMMFAIAGAFTIVPPSGPTFVADIHATTEVGTFDLDHWQAPAAVAIVPDPVVEAISPLAIDSADAARVMISMGRAEGEVAPVEDQGVSTEQSAPSRDTPAPVPAPPACACERPQSA